MSTLSNIVSYLNALLTPQEFEDSSFNGLQVESTQQTVRKIGVAVDSGLSILERAVAEQCNLLIVHHGLLWGSELPISGIYGKKVELLLRAGCSLYASHLPLDGHAEVGNNALLAQHFGLEVTGGFEMIGRKNIGVVARAPKPLPAAHFLERARALPGAGPPLFLPFGAPLISSAGIVSGSGASALGAAAHLKLDLLISGEPKQQVYHEAKEAGINALFAGHYATETVGVRALGERLQSMFGMDWIFIDEPTGI